MAEDDLESGFSKEKYGINHDELEYLGERKVKENLNSGVYGNDKDIVQVYVSSWLKDKEFVRTESRDEERLSISRKALVNSERSTRIAISALVLTIIMVIKDIIVWYSKQP